MFILDAKEKITVDKLLNNITRSAKTMKTPMTIFFINEYGFSDEYCKKGAESVYVNNIKLI